MADTTNALTTPEERKKFKIMIDEIVGAKLRQKSEAEQAKEIVKQIKALYGIKPKVVNAVVKAAMNSDFNEVRDEYNEIVEIYEAVMDV